MANRNYKINHTTMVCSMFLKGRSSVSLKEITYHQEKTRSSKTKQKFYRRCQSARQEKTHF